MTFSTRLQELRDLSYDTGYYAGRLINSRLADDDRKEIEFLLKESIAKRNEVYTLIQHLYAPQGD